MTLQSVSRTPLPLVLITIPMGKGNSVSCGFTCTAHVIAAIAVDESADTAEIRQLVTIPLDGTGFFTGTMLAERSVPEELPDA